MKAKPPPKPPEVEEHPDAWERFGKAFDTVMKAPRKPPPAAKPRREPSPAPRGKRDGTKPA